MSEAYRVYCNNLLNMPSGGGACAYYRILLPLTIMEKLGMPVASIIDNSEMPLNGTQRDALFLESDFTLIYQQLSKRVNQLLDVAAGFKAGKDRESNMHWPPTFIVDTDDDLFNVTPLNISYASLGTKTWRDPLGEGQLADDGDGVIFAHPLEVAPAEVESILNDKHAHPLPGAKEEHQQNLYVYDEDGHWKPGVLLWKDGVNVNFSSNRAKMDAWRDTLKKAHLITCTTPKLANAIRREIGDDANIYVTPNAIEMAAYPKIELKEHKNVRILWEGSMCHHEGLWPLNDSLKRIGEKHPDVEWIFFGAPYKWAFGNLPNVQHIPWCHYEAYKLRMSTFGHDIALAPLAPTIFNQSRSAIRWYENSALWKPAATLAQKTAAFEDEMVEGETGLLFTTPQEFEEKLDALIVDAKLRETLASNSKDWVRTHRDPAKVFTALFLKWVETREGHKRTVPVQEGVLADEIVSTESIPQTLKT